ncbi:hypothetical protein [Mycobacterium avium]|uniref:hypothetical protein n=1 Tax=Mycobacterium avium TaxID=1764 RepID=UPI000A9DAACB|nr:hypothetical protein [Mycobacterium avium]MCG3244472.1 hypothetical protein [Mycobacterium avium subsp. hominissuis]MDV3215418.1 hypothetical protein [Mycobacterium avium]
MDGRIHLPDVMFPLIPYFRRARDSVSGAYTISGVAEEVDPRTGRTIIDMVED